MINNIKDSSLVNVQDLADDEIESIEDYISGAVTVWINLKGSEPFQARDLVPKCWDKTKLDALQCIHADKPAGEAYARAGVDFGWILKSALHKDYREFERIVNSGDSISYKFIDKED